MNKPIIEEIYLSLIEKVPMSAEYEKATGEVYKFYEQLNGVLNDEQKKIFEDYVNSEIEVCSQGESLYFKQGLKFGLRLAIECLT